jgi:lysozyme
MEKAPTHKGIDISRHNGRVDWPAVAASGITFAFLKATEGVDAADSTFADHWEAAGKAKILRGAYHFYVTEDDPEEQARFFIGKAAIGPGDLPPAVDVEILGHGTKPHVADRLKVFLDLVEKHYGRKPIIYTGPNFWDRNMSDRFGGYPLWIAQYGATSPRMPKGWKDWHFWQWSESATVPGVERKVDLNHFNHDDYAMESLLTP